MGTPASRVVASVFLSLIFGFACPASVRARQDPPVQGRLAEIKGLYESAEYDRALAAVDHASPAVVAPAEARDIEIYEALCLLALGKKAEANAKIEGVIRAEPLYQPSTELPNRLRALGVSSAERITQIPDIPTLSEAGVPGYEFTAWIGAFAPAGTPKPIVDKLNADMQKVLRLPDVAEKLKSQTLDPMFMTPEQFVQKLKTDYDKYEKVIKVSGARVD